MFFFQLVHIYILLASLYKCGVCALEGGWDKDQWGEAVMIFLEGEGNFQGVLYFV